MKTFFILLFSLSPLLNAAYTNCHFKHPKKEAMCQKMREKGIGIDYANRMLLSPFANLSDDVTLRLLDPAYLPKHDTHEKKANNALLSQLPMIKAHLERYRTTYDTAEKRYSVNREIIAAILAKESSLGRVKPDHDAFVTLNTIYMKLPENSKRNRRLIAMAETNLLYLASYCYKNTIDPDECRFASSYTGAVGISQFMPMNLDYVVSHDKTRGDLWKMEDAILSAANFLNKAAGFKTPIDWKRMPDIHRLEQAWYDYAASHENATFAIAQNRRNNKPYDCFICADAKYDYLRGYVRTVMNYNYSSNYAVGILSIAYGVRAH